MIFVCLFGGISGAFLCVPSCFFWCFFCDFAGGNFCVFPGAFSIVFWCFFSVHFFVLVPFLFYIRFPLVVVRLFAVLFFAVFECLFFRVFFVRLFVFFSRMRSEGFPFIVGVWGWTCVRFVLLPRRRVVVANVVANSLIRCHWAVHSHCDTILSFKV